VLVQKNAVEHLSNLSKVRRQKINRGFDLRVDTMSTRIDGKYAGVLKVRSRVLDAMRLKKGGHGNQHALALADQFADIARIGQRRSASISNANRKQGK
jgi:hypothetical protein